MPFHDAWRGLLKLERCSFDVPQRAFVTWLRCAMRAAERSIFAADAFQVVLEIVTSCVAEALGRHWVVALGSVDARVARLRLCARSWQPLPDVADVCCGRSDASLSLIHI